MEKLGLEKFDADTLVNSAADIRQLRSAINQPQTRYVSQHSFKYIEMDVVTWRILPSPENVRFEDRRLGQAEPYRFGAVPESQAVLNMHVPSLRELLDDLVEFSLEIFKDSPHTKTIATRGIETGGVLALARITADDTAQVFGVLESTDGFSRTVGAHHGLSLKPRDVLEKLNSSDAELKFRKELLNLRNKDLKGNR